MSIGNARKTSKAAVIKPTICAIRLCVSIKSSLHFRFQRAPGLETILAQLKPFSSYKFSHPFNPLKKQALSSHPIFPRFVSILTASEYNYVLK